MATLSFRNYLPHISSTIYAERAVLAFGNFIINIMDNINSERRKMQTRRELSRLSDRQLNDIGIMRSEINKI